MKEKTGDKMFEELGYRKSEDKWVIVYDCIQYFNHFKEYKKVYFFKLEKEITLKSYNLTDDLVIDFNLTIQELQAINKKCQELRWLDE